MRLLLQNVKGLTFFGTHGRTSVAKQQPVSCTVCGDAVADREDRAIRNEVGLVVVPQWDAGSRVLKLEY